MPEPEKRFTVYVNCEGEDFQDRKFATAIADVLNTIVGNVVTGRFSGAIISKDGTTIGNWKTQWRNADPADRKPVRPPASR